MALNEDNKASYQSAVVALKDKTREIELYLQRSEQNSERVREQCRTLDQLYDSYKRSRQSYIGI